MEPPSSDFVEVDLQQVERLSDTDLYDFARDMGVALSDVPTRERILERLTRLER